MRRKLAAGLCALCLLASVPAQAQQYRSEVRVLERVPDEEGPVDAEKLLSETTDPYARALLLRDLAGRAARGQDYEQAAKYLEQALAQGALSPQAAAAMRQDMSRLLIATGDPDAVIRGLEPSVRGNENASAAQQAALGAAYATKERWREALPLLRRAVAGSEQPEENWLRALLATHIALRQNQEAAQVVERLLERSPGTRDYWLQGAALYSEAGNHRRAQAIMEVAARLGHLSTADDRRQLAGLTARVGAPYQAGALMREWMGDGRVPSNVATQRELASYWLAARESAPAIEAIEAVLSSREDHELLLQLGQLHMDREEYAAAARAFARVAEARPDDADAQMALAVARYQVADVDGALAAFRAAGQAPAQRELARQWIAFLETGRARQQALAAAAERARRGDHDSVDYASQLLGDTVRADEAERPARAPRQVSGGTTPVGAEADGNADGSIPAWEGGLRRQDWPSGFQRGQRLRDPFPDDEPQFVITRDNMEQYAQWLSDGHKALLRAHEGYRLPVYPTRRSAAYPEEIYEATRQNAGRAQLIGSDALEGARMGFPFPRPESGVEVMWNHRVRYRGDSVMARSQQAVVEPGGRVSNRLRQTERVYYRYANLADPVDIGRQNILLYYLTWFSRSGSSVDFLALVHETANASQSPRAVWVLPPGLGRMFRVPPVGYDQPFPGSDGLSFVDMVDMYNGPFDRYVWRLRGKQEMIVPYNGYRLVDGSVANDDLMTGGYLNPEHTRYERHRVWIVEATEREGSRHSFGKRVFYVDEDTWNVVLVENHDRRDRLWRFQEGHLISMYDSLSANAAPVVTYDLRNGRYFVNRLFGEDDPMEYNVPGIRASDYLPATVRARYGR